MDKKALKFYGELLKEYNPAELKADTKSAFDPQWWLNAQKEVGSHLKLKDEAAKKYAGQIANAWGIMDDDENAIYHVFEDNLKDHVQTSQVSYWYEKDRDVPLKLDLQSRLSPDEWKRILQAIVNMKTFRKG